MTLEGLLRPEIIIQFLLIFVRVAGVFVASPLLSNHAVPKSIKVAIVIAMSALLFPTLQRAQLAPLSNHIQLISWVIQELTIGVVIGFAASIIFATIQSAGEIFGFQVGFSIATIIDPTNDSSTGVLASLYVIMGALLFLYLDGHHVILAALSKSFQVLPLAKGFSLQIGGEISRLVSHLFTIAIQLSAPVIVVLTLLSVIFGLLTKLSPQMNIYFNLGFIIGPILGILVLLVTLPLFRVLITQMLEGMGPELIRMIHTLKGA